MRRELQTVKAIGLGAILASNIFLFVPFTLYVGNPDEFAVSFSTILGLYLRPAIFLVAAFGLIGAFLTESAFRRYLILLAAISVLLWVQGNILVWDYGLLDGRRIDWTQSTWRGWVDLGIWLGVILAVTIASVLGLNEKFDGASAFDLPRTQRTKVLFVRVQSQ